MVDASHVLKSWVLRISSSMFDLSQKDDIKLTRMDRVQQIMAELEDLAEEKPEQADRTVHIILFGCMWCYPSYITLRHAHELIYSSKSKGDSKSTNEEVPIHIKCTTMYRYS